MLHVKHMMQPVEEVVHAEHDLREALARLMQVRADLIPVVDGDEVVGVLTPRDINANAGTQCGSRGKRIAEHMTTDIAFCHEDDDVATAIAVMEHKGQRCLLVVDNARQLVGLLTMEALNTARQEDSTGSRSGAGRFAAKHTAAPLGGSFDGEWGQPRKYTIRPRVRK